MRFIICGAGQVGATIAEQLAKEGNEVSLIDQDSELVAKINDTIDATAFVGYASHPATLQKAGADDADMLIAVTYSDEVNMVACQIGYSLFSIPTKIARVRNQHYLAPEWRKLYANDHLALDHIISPEVEVAETILRRLHTPGAMDMIPFMESKLQVAQINCEESSPLTNLPFPLAQKKMDALTARIMGVERRGKFLFASKELMIKADDHLYLVTTPEKLPDVMTLLGHNEEPVSRAVLFGAGNIGRYIANALEADETSRISLKLIEYNREIAERAASELDDSTVLCGSALDRNILVEAGIDHTDMAIAVTNDDETNILASLLAKQNGAERAIALVNNTSYATLWGGLGIDAVVNPRETTVSSILKFVRRGRIRSVYSIANGLAEVIEAEAVNTPALVGKHIGELGLPKEIVINVIVRGEEIIMVNDDTLIQEGDRILILASTPLVKKVERIFSVSVEYF